MSAWMTAHEPAVRLVAFMAVLLLMAAWEIAAARRRLKLPKARRWLANLSLVALDAIVVRLMFPAAAVGAAMVAAQRGWGMLNQVELPAVAAVTLSVVALDLAIYLQHVLFHAVPVLWRLHMVHHADIDVDVTTGTRFHPLEILASMGIKVAMVALIGPPVIAVLLFEVLLNATSMFNHANVGLPAALEGALRWVVVTPDMHRIHHSVESAEADSNFGFNLPWWDRLFGTYRGEPAAGQERLRTGVEHLQDTGPQGVLWMLRLPFSGEPGAYPIDRRRWS